MRDLLKRILFLVPGFIFVVNLQSHAQEGQVSGQVSSGDSSKLITIAGVGDIMPGTSYPSVAFLPPESKLNSLFGTLRDTLRSATVTFGNLEGGFLNSGDPVKKCRDSTNCYLFRIPERYATLLADAGFDLISLANNHTGDFGQPARNRTIKLLDSLGIAAAGLTTHPSALIIRDSLKIGFIAFAPNAGTLNFHDTATTASAVRMLDRECDIVVVSFHAGAEGADNQRVTRQTEFHAGENRGNVYELARLLIDNGADVVFGHGPHVPRAIDLYKDRFIAYSLGNFLTYSRFNILGPNGLAPLAMITVDDTGRFVTGRIVPGYQVRGEGVRYDSRGQAIKKIRELMAADFPDSLISLSEEGTISYK